MTTTLNASTAGAGGFIATSDNSGSLALQTAGTTAVTIDTSQNVGIGTSSPQRLLQVGSNNGEIRIGPSSGLEITHDNSGYTIGEIKQLYATTNASAQLKITSGFTTFQTGTSNTERMRVNSGGNLLVGTTSDVNSSSNRLSVSGTRAAAFTSTGGANEETFTVWNQAASGTIYQIIFRDGSGAGFRGSITTNGTGTAYNTSSDYRLKENIAPMTGALATVAQLKPCRFKWKATNESTQGFIAHELQEVVPECVSGDKDAVDADGKPVYQGIDTSFLVATLTAAIQELKAINDTQAETINALTARIVALEGA